MASIFLLFYEQIVRKCMTHVYVGNNFKCVVYIHTLEKEDNAGGNKYNTRTILYPQHNYVRVKECINKNQKIKKKKLNEQNFSNLCSLQRPGS